ncbi:MAG: hypothetical protein J2P45_18770 [Candidatus Dormibacteraeota bacterium]|nr:hypothetical protein [Candidatus Dormibacteraeota bacterium]
MMGGYALGTGMLTSGLTMVLVLGGLALLVGWAIARFAGARQPAAEEAKAILRRRLAAGEITREQYEQSRRALQR